MEPPVDLTDGDLTLIVQLPEGEEKTATVNGSKPVMDLLVTLCAQYHLNPSDYVIELISTNQNQIKFKPNSLIGSLDAERVVLKAKGADDKNRRKPHMPEATVRLLVNYKKCHKAVVRVNPRVPTSELMSAICEKCEFDPVTTILLRTSQSEEPLDLTKSLNDHGLRELYAKDTKIVNRDPPEDMGTPAHKEGKTSPIQRKSQKEKENRGFFSLFRKSKKTSEQDMTMSAPTSPVLNNQRVDSAISLSTQSVTAPSDMSKKRRAPLPPMMVSQSFPNDLNTSQPTGTSSRQKGLLSRISSTESSLKRTKRRAPAPPCVNVSPPQDSDGNGPILPPLEAIEEESYFSSSTLSDSHLDQYESSTTAYTPPILPSPTMTDVMVSLIDNIKSYQSRLPPSNGSSSIPLAQHTELDPNSSHHTAAQPEVSFEDSAGDSHSRIIVGGQPVRGLSLREGLTTFAIVPQRKRVSQRVYEVKVTLCAPGWVTKAREQACGSQHGLELENIALVDQEMQHVEPCGGGMETLELRHGETERLESIESMGEFHRGREPEFERGELTLGETESPEQRRSEVKDLELKRGEMEDLKDKDAVPSVDCPEGRLFFTESEENPAERVEIEGRRWFDEAKVMLEEEKGWKGENKVSESKRECRMKRERNVGRVRWEDGLGETERFREFVGEKAKDIFSSHSHPVHWSDEVERSKTGEEERREKEGKKKGGREEEWENGSNVPRDHIPSALKPLSQRSDLYPDVISDCGPESNHNPNSETNRNRHPSSKPNLNPNPTAQLEFGPGRNSTCAVNPTPNNIPSCSTSPQLHNHVKSFRGSSTSRAVPRSNFIPATPNSHQTPADSKLRPPSHFNPCSPFDPQPSNGLSLFALAVARRVQSLGGGACSLLHTPHSLTTPMPRGQRRSSETRTKDPEEPRVSESRFRERERV